MSNEQGTKPKDPTAAARMRRYRSRQRAKGMRRVLTYVPTDADRDELYRIADEMRARRAQEQEATDQEED